MPVKGLFARLFSALLFLLPHQMLSRCLAAAVEWRFTPWKTGLILLFCRVYRVNLTEARPADTASYASFGDFFARRIDLGCRPLPAAADQLLCPADGVLSQFGTIDAGQLIQAKGRRFTVAELLDDAHMAETYATGSFCTIYLSPRDYHRVHMPADGELDRLVPLPGRLFSVQDATARHIPRLYARNERAVFHFTSNQGPFVVVMVGAIFVSGIATVWGGVMNRYGERDRRWDQRFTGPGRVTLNAGDELGTFRMGSTAIVLTPGNVFWHADLVPGAAVRVRAGLGKRVA